MAKKLSKFADAALDRMIGRGTAHAQCSSYFGWYACTQNPAICSGGWIQYEYFQNGACLRSRTGDWRCC